MYAVIARLGTSRGNLLAALCHAERKRSISRFALPPTVSESLRFFTPFRMTTHGVILYNVMLSNAKHLLEADQRQR